MNDTKKLATIDTLLQGVPAFKCIDGCTDCCGPVAMTRLEWKRVVAASGKSERDLNDRFAANIESRSFGCPMVDKEKGCCSVYSVRPAICHMFGAVDHERLVCPHGKRPDKLMSNDDCGKILDKIEKLGY